MASPVSVQTLLDGNNYSDNEFHLGFFNALEIGRDLKADRDIVVFALFLFNFTVHCCL